MTKNRILIVEDEVFVRLDEEEYLTQAGYEIVGGTGSADEAVSLAERLMPDLILMDVRLHGKRDGIEAAIEIRQRFNIPSLFVSANIEKQTFERAVAAAPLGYVSKPFTAQTLIASVKEALLKA